MKGVKRLRGIEQLKNYYGHMFTLPWLIGIIIFFIFPLIQSVLYSFSKITVMENAIKKSGKCLEDLTLSEMEDDVIVPEKERCESFVESHYTPYIISEMVNEGIYLTHALINMTGTFDVREIKSPEPEVERVRPPRRRFGSTDSLRKKHS